MMNGTLRVSGSVRNPHDHFPERFYSWGTFDESLSEFCALTYQIFRVRTSQTIAKHKNAAASGQT